MNEMTNSHILAHEFGYREPATLEEAIALLSEYGDRARLLAGGSDLLVHMKMERVAPEVVISLRRIAGLDKIEWTGQELRVGALVSIRELRRHSIIATDYPALAEACASFSTTQIQMMGTVGGNLCNGSPAADSAPALIAYGSEVVLAGPEGERRLPVEAFFKGPGKTALQRGELLKAVVLPWPNVRGPEAYATANQAGRGTQGNGAPGKGTGGAFLKISRVAADIAKANCAVTLGRDGECIVDCRIALGSVAPVPMRARRAESLLVGQERTPELMKRAAILASEEVAPIDDVRSSALYRRQIVAVMVHDGLERAWERSHAASKPVAMPAAGDHLTATQPANGANLRHALEAQGQCEISLTVNGSPHRLRVAPNDLLLTVLREELALTGTKYGCGIGECSACTVHMDGLPVLACLVLAVSADGSEIVTVEGLQGPHGELDPLQEAFLDHAAFQCGFCTPGMLMTAKSLMKENPAPTEDEVRDYMKGNLCRCTGYASIVRAIMGSAKPDLVDL